MKNNMVNVFRAYQNANSALLQLRLEKLADAILATTEGISEELISKELYRNRKWIFGGEYAYPVDKGQLEVCAESGIGTTVEYDETAAEELDEFLFKQFPGITCARFYELDLYEGTITFYFEYDSNLVDEDFTGLVLKPASEHKNNSWTLQLFSNTVKTFSKKEPIWNINYHKGSIEYRNGRSAESNIVLDATCCLEMPIG